MQRCKPGLNISRSLSRRYPKKSMSNFRIASKNGLSVGVMLVLSPVLLEIGIDVIGPFEAEVSASVDIIRAQS
jgi:hypothetical protein